MPNTPTDAEIEALDPDKMSPEERIAFINLARIERQAGKQLTEPRLRFVVRCMRSERKVSASNAGAKKKAPVEVTALSSF